MKSHTKLRFTGRDRESILCYAIMIVGALVCLFPFLYCLGSGFEDQKELLVHGYTIIPRKFSLDTYKYLLITKGDVIINAFKNTVLVCLLGVIINVSVTTAFAWPCTQSKKEFPMGRPLSFFGWFAGVFGGGVFAWYVLCTQYYGLKNNLWALIIPSAFSMGNMFIMRGNFRTIPADLLDAARIDGASAARTFFKIALPLAKGGVATIALYTMLGYWNDIWLPKWLISKTTLMTLQSFLERMQSNAAFVAAQTANKVFLDMNAPPTEAVQIAVTTLSIVPLMLIYPFSLRYFVKGINMGGIKG